MFLWTGLDQGCLRDHFRRARDLKMKENKRIYGFTDFRGKPGRRGRGRHASANQVTAGSFACYFSREDKYRLQTHIKRIKVV